MATQITQTLNFSFTNEGFTPIPLSKDDELYVVLEYFPPRSNTVAPLLGYYNNTDFGPSTTSGVKYQIINQGSLEVYADSFNVGYNIVECNPKYLSTGSLDNTLVLSEKISEFYGGDYQFLPDPPSDSYTSSLYNTYGDVNYPFKGNPFDIAIVYLSDGNYVELKIIEISNVNNQINIKLEKDLPVFVKDEIQLQKYKRFLWLARIEDETNAYLSFKKRPGLTSYGFIIPEDLSPDMLANIDTITKEVKQKLLADQQGTTSG